MNNPTELIQQIVADTIQQGADECDVILTRNKSLTLSSFEQKIDKYQISSSQIVGLRVIKDKKVGLAASETLEESDLQHLIKQAIENARNSSSSPYQTISNSLSRPNHQSHESDFRPDESTIEEKIEFAIALESSVKELDSSAKVPYTSYYEVDAEEFFANSLNITTYNHHNYFTGYNSALLQAAGNSATHFSMQCAERFKMLNAKQCATTSYDMAHNLLTATACSTAKYDVIFDINQLSKLFARFSSLFLGKSAMEGMNRWKEMLGKQVASKNLTIMDLPAYEDALIHWKFDNEGHPVGDVTLIQNGILESFLHSSETANYFKVQHNARSARSPKSGLEVLRSNTVIMPGSEENLYAGKVLKIIGLDGIHSGANVISGEFSFGARGILYNNGEVEQFVKGITISANFFELLSQIKAIGTKLEGNENRDFFAPEIRFDQIDVAGK